MLPRPLLFKIGLSDTLFKAGVASFVAVIADGLVKSSWGRQNPNVTFGSGNGGIEQVPLEHYIVAGVQYNYDGGIFAALAFVDGAGVGQGQFIQFLDRKSVV